MDPRPGLISSFPSGSGASSPPCEGELQTMSFASVRVSAALAALGLALSLGTAGCSSAPPPPPPTIVNLTMTTGPDTNPNAAGQGAPVIVRIYQLSSPA